MHPAQKEKIGIGELNKRMFIEEPNAAEYFSVSGEVAKYLPMKSTQRTHAEMKRTAVSLWSVLADQKKSAASVTSSVSRAVN